MAEPFRQLRRKITQLAIRKAIETSKALPISRQRSRVRRLVSLAGGIPMVRGRIRKPMRLALGDGIPPGAERRFFQQLGWELSSSVPTFHHGLAATPVMNEMKFDETISVLDDAMAEKRGVVLLAPHWAGHELALGLIAHRHPMGILVRQGSASDQVARKAQWYSALGAEMVLRPNQPSTMKDAVSYLKVLKRGKILAIMPDLLAAQGEGVEVSIFGRPARMPAGAFAFAMTAGAPMIRFSLSWQSASSVVVRFERAPPPPDTDDREAAIRASLQEFCRWFEEKVRANPENWLFWLDKRWYRFFRETARTG